MSFVFLNILVLALKAENLCLYFNFFDVLLKLVELK